MKPIIIFGLPPLILIALMLVGGFFFYPLPTRDIFFFGLAFFGINLILNLLLFYNNLRLDALNKNLEESAKELDGIGKILIKRDLELTEANARLQELDALKSEFVSVAAHQLRTPVSTIKWILAYLLEEDSNLTAKQKEKLENGLKISNYMVELIDDLLNIARIEEGRFGFKFKVQPLLPLIENIFQRYKDIAEKKGINFSLNLPHGLPFDVNLDEEKIGIVLDNLLDNAVKYTPIGREIVLSVAKIDTEVRVEVRDTGIGIPKNQLHKIFSKFFRGSNAMLLETAGTGLGLYVSKNIVEAHDGTMTVDSVEGQGTVVAFTLPLAAM